MKISTNWLKDFVALAPPLERIAERLTLAGLEVKKVEATPDRKDVVFEIEITTNRPDWLSHLGVAREIAAVENTALKVPWASAKAEASRTPAHGWKIHLKDQDACPYYTGVYMEGIDPSLPAPDFMRDRLTACGVRPVSLIVDITNYVLLETGQPLHAFDADLLRGKEILVRRARSGEKMTAIDGKELILEPSDLVIADADRAVALAGIMGGRETEISARTRNIFLESAFFLPRGVRLSSRRIGLSSDSSYRFERRVDPEGVDLGRERAVSLIQQYLKPRFTSAVLRAGQSPARPVRIHLTSGELEKRLGVKIKPHQIASVFTRLGLESKQDGAETWKVEVPSFRADLTEPVDLLEEAARIYGFEEIPETLPARAPSIPNEDARLKLEDATRNYFSGLGFFEAVTFSLISGRGLDPEKDLGNAVKVHNPQNSELCWMRPHLWPGLLGVVQKNTSFGAGRIMFYEQARVYRIPEGAKQAHEEPAIGIVMSGKWRLKNWLDSEREATFHDLKGILESYLACSGLGGAKFEPSPRPFLLWPGAEKIMIAGREAGFLGEISPAVLKAWDLEDRVFYAELFLPVLAEAAVWKKTFREIPKFPAVERDLAVVVEESVHAGKIEEDIRSLGGPLLKEVILFDLFRGGRVPKGYKNLAFRLVYQSRERTLVSADIQTLHGEIAEKIAALFQASFQ